MGKWYSWFEEYVEPLKVYLLKYRGRKVIHHNFTIFLFLFCRRKEIKHTWRNKFRERKKLEVDKSTEVGLFNFKIFVM